VEKKKKDLKVAPKLAWSMDSLSLIDMENPDDTSKAGDAVKRQWKTYYRNHGGEAEITLKAAFKLTDLLIGQYKLDAVDKVLLKMEEPCKNVGGQWYTKWIQMKAFCRWKQSKFREALVLFEEMKEIVGPSSKLMENTGHTHNSLGEYKKAQDCFEEALKLLEVEEKMYPDSGTSKGGLYMGLGLVKKRRGNPRAGLVDLRKSLQWYKRNTGPNPHSLVAKAYMSCGHCYEDLLEWGNAAKMMRAAVPIFEETCSNRSPLTGNAWGCLGKVCMELKQYTEAWKYLELAFCNEVKQDSLKIHELFERANLLYQLHSAHKPENANAENLVPSLRLMEQGLERQMKTGIVKRNGDVGALYKTGAELAICAKYFKLASELIQKALRHFGEEKKHDCGKLIEECRTILTLVHSLIVQGIGN